MRDPQRHAMWCAIRASTGSHEVIHPDARRRATSSSAEFGDGDTESPFLTAIATAGAISDQLRNLREEPGKLRQHPGIHEGSEGGGVLHGGRQTAVDVGETLSPAGRGGSGIAWGLPDCGAMRRPPFWLGGGGSTPRLSPSPDIR